MAAGILGGGVAVGRGMSAVSAWTGMQTNPVLNQARTDSNPLRIKKVTPYILQLQRDSLTEISQVHFVLARHRGWNHRLGRRVQLEQRGAHLHRDREAGAGPGRPPNAPQARD